MEGRSLLLNASFQPLQIITWQRALQLFFLGKVEIIETSDKEIHSVSITIRMPLVIRLLKYLPINKKRDIVRFTRNNVLLRDHYTCQYCGDKPPIRELTLDHVKPIVKGGKKTWENIITACRNCNLKKGGRTPEEASMILKSPPKHPSWLPFCGINIDFTKTTDQLHILVKNYTGKKEID